MGRPLPQPNYTQVPNVLLDHLDDFKEAELRVILAAIRNTIGWHRSEPQAMSIAWFESETGLSRQGVVNGIKAARERGWLVESDKRGPRGVKLYQVQVSDDWYSEDEAQESTKLTSQKIQESTKLTSTSQPSGLVLVNDVDQSRQAIKEKKETPKEKKTSASGDARRSDQPEKEPVNFKLIYDALAVAYDMGESGDIEAEKMGGRVGMIASWLDGRKGTLQGKRLGKISKPAQPEHVAAFARDWKAGRVPGVDSKGLSLPRDPVKFVEHWRAWATGGGKSREPGVPAGMRSPWDKQPETDGEHVHRRADPSAWGRSKNGT